MSETRAPYANDLQRLPRHFENGDGNLVEELEWTNRLLVTYQEARDRLLDAIPPCPAHGNRCIPHALEWIEKAKAVTA